MRNLEPRTIWQRIPLWIRAVILGVFVSSLGIYTWLFVASLLPAPWPAFVMAVFLFAYVMFFSGKWGPKSTQEARRERFRSTRITTRSFTWSLISACLIVVIWQSALVVTFRIIEYPSDVSIYGYNTEGMPIWGAWLLIIMSSMVAGICEEIGYRGYMQVPLEMRYRPIPAIILVSITFVIIHLDQVWATPLLFHLFMLSVLLGVLAYSSGSLIPGILAHFGLDIFNFSYW